MYPLQEGILIHDSVGIADHIQNMDKFFCLGGVQGRPEIGYGLIDLMLAGSVLLPLGIAILHCIK